MKKIIVLFFCLIILSNIALSIDKIIPNKNNKNTFPIIDSVSIKYNYLADTAYYSTLEKKLTPLQFSKFPQYPDPLLSGLKWEKIKLLRLSLKVTGRNFYVSSKQFFPAISEMGCMLTTWSGSQYWMTRSSKKFVGSYYGGFGFSPSACISGILSKGGVIHAAVPVAYYDGEVWKKIPKAPKTINIQVFNSIGGSNIYSLPLPKTEWT